MSLRGTAVLRQNILALIVQRQTNQTEVAFAVGLKGASALNKFLKGAKDKGGKDRELQLHQIEKIAAHFSLEVYQLFAPGITPTLERRTGKDRRRVKDRRQKQPPKMHRRDES